ncbi:MAG: hypothetical protein JWM44_4477 [Bacilli bacterium]|nr:hypothetical protein [Bacilli bacterium]
MYYKLCNAKQQCKALNKYTMSIINKLNKSAKTKIADLTASQFFTDTNTNGYVSKEDFLFHMDNLQTREALELEQFFTYLQGEKRLDALPVPRKDRAGNEYIWCNFQLRNGSPGVKILLFDRILDFIKDYQDGAFSVAFSLVGLYEEAEKTSNVA